jgi:hypothetical protein
MREQEEGLDFFGSPSNDLDRDLIALAADLGHHPEFPQKRRRVVCEGPELVGRAREFVEDNE